MIKKYKTFQKRIIFSFNIKFLNIDEMDISMIYKFDDKKIFQIEAFDFFVNIISAAVSRKF